MLFPQGAYRLRRFFAMSLLTLAVAAGMSPRVRAAEESRLPEKAKLYFIGSKTIFVGDLELQRRGEEEFLRGARDDAPDRELRLTLGGTTQGRTLSMNFVNYYRGAIESQGYAIFDPLTKHDTLGEGRQGLMVQTHLRIDGRLVAKRVSTKVFMQFDSVPDVVIEGPPGSGEEPQPRFTAPRPQPQDDLSLPEPPPVPEVERDVPSPQPAPLPRDEEEGPQLPEPGPGPNVEPEDESPEPAPLPLPPSTLPEGRDFRH